MKYYTRDEIETLKNIDIIEFITKENFNYKKENNAYRLLDFDGGLYVFEKNNNTTSGFYWHKYNQKGNIIDFCKLMYNEDYINALERLSNFNQSVKSLNTKDYNYTPTVKSLNTSSKTFKLPERDKIIKQAYTYLLNTRGINKKLIDDCIKQGIIRQFKEKNWTYVGFIGQDKEGQAKYLMLRSTLSNISFKKETEGSDKKYGFKVFDKTNINQNFTDIYIFESPIDLLSYMSLNPQKNLENNAFLSMGGTSNLALQQFIDDYKPYINQINVCFDNDEAGQENAKKIKELYKDKYKVNILKPIYKDYNEQLLYIKQITEKSNSNDIQNQIINQVLK